MMFLIISCNFLAHLCSSLPNAISKPPASKLNESTSANGSFSTKQNKTKQKKKVCNYHKALKTLMVLSCQQSCCYCCTGDCIRHDIPILCNYTSPFVDQIRQYHGNSNHSFEQKHIPQQTLKRF